MHIISRTGAAEENPRQRSIEILGDEWHWIPDPHRPQVGFARREIQAPSLPMGHQIADGATVACHHDGFPGLDLSSQLSQPILGISGRHGFHELDYSRPLQIGQRAPRA
jgi:hypothetical protein